ncbi:hypothetical protein KIW84_013750 [Lathyrus oleraceus]|uniref:Reverse transcriptase n=1 Tax=Pisum sativum TaxID=3888 RepID=A0A9D5BLI2_PEA|nr:hypothetical protein KIW84_013750 [Pisum sativum]
MEERTSLIALVTMKEIEKAQNDIGDLKVPDMDEYGSKFFKVSWTATKKDFIAAVLEFFMNGKMYRAINRLLVTLIPKSPEAKTIRCYTRKGGVPRCMLQMDLQKAYDTVD